MKNKEIEELLNKAKDIAEYGADGKQHTRMFNQFEAKALLSYIEQLEKQAELREHYKHLYSELKKQKDDVVEYINTAIEEGNYFEDDIDTDIQPASYDKYVNSVEILRMLCKIYITDLETNKNSKEINVTDLIFDDNLEFEFGNYEDEDYLQLPYNDFKFFINDYSVTFYSPQYHKLQSNWNNLREWLKNLIDNFQEDVSTPILHEQMTIRLVYEYMENLDKMNELEGKDTK